MYDQLTLDLPLSEGNLDLERSVKCANKGCEVMLGPSGGHYVVGLHVRVCSNQCYHEAFHQRESSPVVCIGNCKICLHCDN
jgi:hypothetical protein